MCLISQVKNGILFDLKFEQGIRRDLQKIHGTRQFLETSDPHGHFFEKKQETWF